MAALELEGIRKRYRGKAVLRDVNLSAERGSCVGLIGRNGSGKSTLLNILAGVLPPDGGRFFWEGQELFSAPALRRDKVGFVPQSSPLFEELSALDNLRLWYDRESLKRELDSGVLLRLGIPDFLKARVSRLSGGMKKRLTIGCALAKQPSLLLLDEPSAALDLAGRAELAEHLSRLRGEGATLLLATHDVQEIAFCDALCLLRDGVLTPWVWDGDPRSLGECLK